MKVAVVLASLVVGASAFGVVPSTIANVRSSSALQALVPESDMSPDQLEMKRMVAKWHEVRLLSREEASAQLEGEYLEAYNRFYEKYDQDMALMLEIKEKVAKMIEPDKIAKKSIKQRKRDKFAKVQAREAAIAAKAR